MDAVKVGGEAAERLEILTNVRRMNVAMTRSRIARIIVSSEQLVAGKYQSEGVVAWEELIKEHQQNQAVLHVTGKAVDELLSMKSEYGTMIAAVKEFEDGQIRDTRVTSTEAAAEEIANSSRSEREDAV